MGQSAQKCCLRLILSQYASGLRHRLHKGRIQRRFALMRQRAHRPSPPIHDHVNPVLPQKRQQRKNTAAEGALLPAATPRADKQLTFRTVENAIAVQPRKKGFFSGEKQHPLRFLRGGLAARAAA